jgi:hypothetical protein
MTRLHKAETWNPAWSVLPKYAQVKEDGHRLIALRRQHDVALLSTSFVNLTKSLDYLWWNGLLSDYLDARKVGVQVDGELVLPGGTSEDVKRAIAQKDTALQFKAFGTTYLPDNESVQEVEDHLAAHRFMTPGIVSTANHTVDTLLGYAAAKKWEGWILKDGNYLNWYKLKLERTIDVVVTGIKPGRGKYSTMIGSFEVSIGETRIGNVAGMPDEVRAMMAGACVDRVIEVKYQRVGRNGRLVLPRMLRWRDDKTPEDCKLNQDPMLEMKYA